MADRWPGGRPAAVTLTFDGGYRESVANALPRLEERGFPSTWFLVAGAIGNTLEGRAVAGWDTWCEGDPARVEIGNHSLTHPLARRGFAEHLQRARHAAHRLATSGGIRYAAGRVARAPSDASLARRGLGAEAVAGDFAAGKTLLEARLGRPVSSFAYPSGRAGTRLRREVQRMGHASARTSTAGLNDPRAIRPFGLRAETWTADQPDGTAAGWLDRAVGEGAWLIEVLHVVGDGGDYGWKITPDAFAAHLDALADAGVWVASQGEVLAHVQAQEPARC